MRRLVPFFVVFHACAIFVSSLPSPGQGLNRKNWDDPTVQGEFATWAGILGVETDVLQDQIFGVAKAVQAGRDALMVPFRQYLHLSGSGQSWKMFVAAHRYPTRFQIQVQGIDSAWETVYYERDPNATWRAGRFNNERLRASVFAWGWPSASKRYHSACNTFASELFEEKSDILAVRCRFLKRRSPSPAEVLSGEGDEGKWVLERIVLRLSVGP